MADAKLHDAAPGKKQEDPNDAKINALGVVIKSSDMSKPMQLEVAQLAVSALQEHLVESDVANALKEKLQELYPRTWQCIVGRNFGSMVTHEAKFFCYLYIGQLAFLLFKSA
jgi:dynein light chain LC8-type